MSAEIIIAIIASLTSLLVGVTTLVITIINNRHSARSLVEFEKIKLEFSRSTIIEGRTDAHLTEYVQALQGAIQVIQKVKDETQIALETSEMSHDLDLALREIISARENIFAYYEKHLAILSNREANLLHDAKNISLQIEGQVRKLIQQTKSSEPIPDEHKQKLAELRNRLTDTQQGFRDSRAELILKRLGLPRSWFTNDDKPSEVVKGEEKLLASLDHPNSAVNDPSSTHHPAPADRNIEDVKLNGAAANSGEQALKGLRILVAEDYGDARETITTVLESLGADVRACISGVEAYLILCEWKPHVLIADINLPYEDGYTLINRIRKLDAKSGGNTPAIAITAHSADRERHSMIAAGYQSVVTKPFEFADLVQVIVTLTTLE